MGNILQVFHCTMYMQQLLLDCLYVQTSMLDWLPKHERIARERGGECAKARSNRAKEMGFDQNMYDHLIKMRDANAHTPTNMLSIK